ncbi:MAG TPA: hypothetical protein VLD18_04885 [Verrucomicrobiae bacterium]|nr:hypothetical protein [Verrucomicrobiae bacterium]
MKRILVLLALVVAVGGLSVWFATGAHRGWSQTSVQTMQLDEITGIETPVYEDRFVAGVDFLGAALLGAGALAAGSLFFRKTKNQH